jgi:Mn2+/Fe2+ NRAMP family transporter
MLFSRHVDHYKCAGVIEMFFAIPVLVPFRLLSESYSNFLPLSCQLLFLVSLISEQIAGMICGANSKLLKKQKTDY